MSTEFFETSDLLLTNGGVIDFEDVNRVFVLKAILVDADDLLVAGVDTGLRTCSCFLDTHFRNTCFDSGCHTAEFLNLLDMRPFLVGNLLGKGLYVVGTSPRVNLLADFGFLLDINLRVTSDTSGEVGRKGNRLVEGVGV